MPRARGIRVLTARASRGDDVIVARRCSCDHRRSASATYATPDLGSDALSSCGGFPACPVGVPEL
jgi:hypothetical protein